MELCWLLLVLLLVAPAAVVGSRAQTSDAATAATVVARALRTCKDAEREGR